MRLSRYIWIAIQIAAVLGVPARQKRVAERKGGYKKLDDKEPLRVRIKSGSEQCIKMVLDRHWAGKLGRIWNVAGFTALQKNCEIVKGDISNVRTGDWQSYLQEGSNRCYTMYCAKLQVSVSRHYID
ncbi:MAG: hypothetical protein M1816_002510 [Peltula sp. TS41687]|nr:MAG: hypothetical protein M1816_002510 [Peltula sp. TS41687]